MNDIAKADSTEILSLDNNILNQDFVKLAEQRFDVINKVKKMSLSVTNQHDWVDMGGKPYLTSGGCQKIARLFGISWQIIRNDKTRDPDTGHYFYVVTGEFWINKHENEKITEIGTKSTQDKFFGKVRGQQRPVSEIDEPNLQKSAVTNCIARGISSILGLRNISWKDINPHMKEKPVASVSYASGGGGGGKISEAQGKILYAISKKAGITPDQMKDYLMVNYSLESSRDIDKGQMYEEICAWAESQGAS